MGNVGYNMRPLLICDMGHWTDVPKVSSDGIVGEIRCAECFEPMVLISYTTINKDPDWSHVTMQGKYDARGTWYK